MNPIDRILNAPSPAPVRPLPPDGDARWRGWPPTPPPATPDEVRIERERLRRIQAELPAAAGPLEKAVREVAGLQIAETSFTSFTYSLAVAYNEVEAYTVRELGHRAEEAVVIGDGVRYSADTWDAAENASTVRVVRP
ncbi:hypothetical protein [Actinomadura roseirufa]|uniref:hypothetical protein n=1 Tax=Actinomadura roseirufa TaxID=2094049 RepID=UPI0010410334|nr:hypothetical protein [Actinomadura roseirufa]